MRTVRTQPVLVTSWCNVSALRVRVPRSKVRGRAQNLHEQCSAQHTGAQDAAQSSTSGRALRCLNVRMRTLGASPS